MRLLLSILILFSFSACSKKTAVKDDTCLNKEAKQNSAGKRLPVAISYTMPAAWQRSSDTSPMKLEERIIDPISQSKIKVFYFEGMKDKNEENLARWKSQFKEEGQVLIAQQVIERNGISIVEFIMSGTYLDKIEPMNPDSKVTLRAGSTMRAYIVETQTGTWFFKAVAPSNVINIQESNFDNFVNSIKDSQGRA